MPIEIRPSRGKSPYPIITRIFDFPAKKAYKLSMHIYNQDYPVIDMNKINEVLEHCTEWAMTKTQFRNLLKALAPEAMLMRVDSSFNGMIDVVESNEDAEFLPMNQEDKDRIIGKLNRYSPYKVYFNAKTKEFTLWSLALGGYTFTIDPDNFDEEFRGCGR